MDLTIATEKFVNAEFPSLVKRYILELGKDLDYSYQPVGTVGFEGLKLSTFDAVNQMVLSEFGVPFELKRYFDFHNDTIFRSKPIEFGFTAVNQYPTSSQDTVRLEAPFNRVNFFLFNYEPFGYLSNLSSKIIRDKVKGERELYFELIRQELRAHIKRYLLYGGVEWRWIVLDQLVRYGLDSFPRCLQKEYGFLEYCVSKESDMPEGLTNKNIDDFSYAEVVRYFKLQVNDDATTNAISSSSKELGQIRLTTAKTLMDWGVSPHFSLDFDEVFSDEGRIHRILETYNEPENHLRSQLGFPNIGEGWISETNLYYEIKNHFSEDVVIHHGKPRWLGKQHLDIWLPKYNIGIEYQGDQHFYPVEFFGGEASLAKNKARDKRKKQLCEKFGCKLIYVLPDYDIDELTELISRYIKSSK